MFYQQLKKNCLVGGLLDETLSKLKDALLDDAARLNHVLGTNYGITEDPDNKALLHFGEEATHICDLLVLIDENAHAIEAGLADVEGKKRITIDVPQGFLPDQVKIPEVVGTMIADMFGNILTDTQKSSLCAMGASQPSAPPSSKQEPEKEPLAVKAVNEADPLPPASPAEEAFSAEPPPIPAAPTKAPAKAKEFIPDAVPPATPEGEVERDKLH